MHRARMLVFLIVLASLLVGFVPASLGAQDAAGPTEPVVVRLYFSGQAQLDAVAGELDIWEVHDGYVVAAVAPEQYRWLADLGYRLEIDAEKTEWLGIDAPLDPRFYYFDDNYTNPNGLYMVDFLQQTNTTYPGIVELIDIGDAWQAGHGGYHRDLWVLRISNEDPAFGDIADKPPFYLMANIHAREVTTPEMAIRYIKYLTSGYNGQGGYGIDPDVTWLVDWNVVYIEVSQNPDGHRVNEANTSAYWRKNLNDTECPGGDFGIDLNRNHSFFWGCCGGSSGNPCSETYRGVARASEPETQAYQNYFAATFTDWNGPNGDDELPPAAPDDASGIMLTLHTYSDLVLWPWGHTASQAPNGAQLRTIGRKFAYYNNYTPQQAYQLYATDGTTDDWSYGKFGGASFTFEIGPGGGSCGGFFPDYECMEGEAGRPQNFWAENRPAFLFAHKIARTPYMTAYGPDTQNLTVTPNPVPQGVPVDLSALIQDHRYGGDPLATIGAAEYFIDEPGLDGTGTAMAPQDGSWGGTSETAIATVDTSALAPGTHYILVHGKKQSTPNDYWGPFTAIFLTVESSQPCGPVEILDVFTATAGCVVTFSAELTGTAPFAYDWDFGAVGSSTDPTPTVDFGSSGTYPYTLTVTNCQTRTDTFEGSVTVSCCDPVHDAAFTWAPPMPVVSETVTFTGTAVGDEPITYTWDFGDGDNGAGASVSHAYEAPGDYTVVMTATNCGTATAVVTHTVTVIPVACDPVHDADFTWSPITPLVSETVAFTGTALGDEPITYAWDFGDGQAGSGANVSHAYGAAGDYTVVLTATNCGTATAVVTHTVTVEAMPCDPVHDAAFDWTPVVPYVGDVVTFTASAAGDPPITYTWDLGDASTAAGAVVTHSYAATGTYTVVLTATNCGGATDTVVHQVIVIAPGQCVPAHQAEFSFVPSAPAIFNPITFTASVSGDPPFTYTWDLGDGTAGDGLEVTHAYTLPGAYTVVLTATNCQGVGQAVVTHVVNVLAYRVYLPLVLRSWP